VKTEIIQKGVSGMSTKPETSLECFSGVVRLFPLPNLVLFPYTIQPLHIFEPRYRQLMEDALNDDRLIAMALLQPGWEEAYQHKPPIYPVVCVGQIAAEDRLDDGRFNLLLKGARRARVLQELQTDRLYRTAQVSLLNDTPVQSPASEQALCGGLRAELEAGYAQQLDTLVELRRLLDSGLPLGALCDVIAFAIPLEVGVKQELLAEVCVKKRAGRLIALLRDERGHQARADAKFPPEFSTN
jgi:Lon protease-like protein